MTVDRDDWFFRGFVAFIVIAFALFLVALASIVIDDGHAQDACEARRGHVARPGCRSVCVTNGNTTTCRETCGWECRDRDAEAHPGGPR